MTGESWVGVRVMKSVMGGAMGGQWEWKDANDGNGEGDEKARV